MDRILRWTRRDIFIHIYLYDLMTHSVKFHMGSFTHENWSKRWVNFMYETSHVNWSDERDGHMWKLMDQMWYFREWSFLYKTHYSVCFSWMNLCVWKRHVWSIAEYTRFATICEQDGLHAKILVNYLITNRFQSEAHFW